MVKKKTKTDLNNEEGNLKKFEININEFGEIDSSVKKEDLNNFLNKFHQDSKIQDSKDSLEEE